MAEASYPEDLLYHPEHDWARIEGETRHARHHLVRAGRARRGRVLRAAGGRDDARQGRALRRGRVGEGRLRRDRAAVGGDRRGQRRLVGDPGAINEDPYGEGWLVKIRLAEPAEREALLDADAYSATLGG